MNIMPSDKPSDIYQLVADKSIVALKKMTDRNEPVAQNGQEDGPTDAELAQWWLDFGVTRKITKRNCMTFPYGSKQRGFSDQILEDTLNPHVKAHGDIEFNPMKLSAILEKINNPI